MILHSLSDGSLEFVDYHLDIRLAWGLELNAMADPRHPDTLSYFMRGVVLLFVVICWRKIELAFVLQWYF